MIGLQMAARNVEADAIMRAAGRLDEGDVLGVQVRGWLIQEEGSRLEHQGASSALVPFPGRLPARCVAIGPVYTTKPPR